MSGVFLQKKLLNLVILLRVTIDNVVDFGRTQRVEAVSQSHRSVSNRQR